MGALWDARGPEALSAMGLVEPSRRLAASVALFNVYNTRDDLWPFIMYSYVMAIPGGQECGNCGRTPYLGTSGMIRFEHELGGEH